MSDQKPTSGGKFNVILDQESWDILTRSISAIDPFKRKKVYDLVDQIRYKTNLPPRPGVEINIK